jgi:hypothetical protein
MKELIQKNKFKHRLGPGGYKAAIPLWTKKEQELHEARILDPLEGCTLHTRNYIRGQSHIDDNRQLITSNMILLEWLKMPKIASLKRRSANSSRSVALETEEYRGHTWAISSIASWKEGFGEDIHMYKKRGRHDIDAKSANKQFAT